MSVVKELPNGWNLVQFSDVCEIVSGKNQKDVVNDSGAYPIYGSGGKMGYANDYLCDPGTTIVGRKGTINKPIFVKDKFWNVDTAFGLSPYDGINKLLFHFFCLSFNFKSLDKSTTIPSLAKTDLLQIEFPLPPLPEQHRIVAKIEELFSDLDKGIESLKTAQGQLKTYRQAVLKYAFEGKLTNKNVKDGELPEGWKREKLLDMCDFITKGTTPPANKLYPLKGDVPFLKVYNLMFNGCLDFSINPTFVSVDTHKNMLARSKVIPGDVLMNIVGPPLGKVSIVPALFPEWNINQAIVRFRCKEALFNKYLSSFLQADRTIRAYSRKAKATAGQFNLTLEICREIDIPLPETLEEQHLIVSEIESRLSVCDKMEESITQSLVQAEALRQSILKKAFEGRLVPQDPNDLPASVLLERIRAEREKNNAMKAAKPRRAGMK